MEHIVYRITLDTHKGGIQRTLQGFETADTMSRQIAVSLVSGPDTYDLPKDHVTALMYVSNDDANEPSIYECSIFGNTILFDVPKLQEGVTTLQLKLIEGDMEGARHVLASPKFAVEVSESNADDEGAEQTTAFTALENAIAKAKEVYDERLLRVDIGKDCVFRAYYADGSVYENYYLYEALYNGNALLSESWAKGGTGIRDGEDTNNAKYFSNVSKSAAEDMDMVSTEARELLEEARLQTTFTSFHVDFETGNLGYLSANYTFNVNEETGNLEAENDGSYDPEQVIGSVVDEYIDQKSEELTEKVDTAVSIAKGKNQAHVFSTTEDMSAWLSNADNKGLYNVGDNLYIVATDVPDWWISEVLDEVDSETGYYYKIAQLETQKVDLTEIIKSISENTKNINSMQASILDTMEEIEANTQDNQLAGALSLKEMNAAHKSDISAVNKSMEEKFKKVVAKTDIIDNLESSETEKPLSAKQGKILKENFEDYLPLSGGTLDGPLRAKTGYSFQTKLHSTTCAVGYESLNNDDTLGGGIGFFGSNGNNECAYFGVSNEPWSFDKSLVVYPDEVYFKGNKIHHEGNKPHGTYAGLGNGNRIIDIMNESDANYSGCLYVYSFFTHPIITFVSEYGSINFNLQTLAISSHLSTQFKNGKLWIASDDTALNISGATHAWIVL